MFANPGGLRRIICCSIILLSFGVVSMAQETEPKLVQNENDIVGFTKNFYGTNDVLVNGRKYIPQHFKAGGNPYFLGENWMKGTVSVAGSVFENVDLLYNIETDQLVLRTNTSNNDTVFVVLNDETVDHFIIDGNTFIRSGSLRLNQNLSGYFEEVYNGSFSFLIKHQKSYISDYSKTSPNGHYSKLYTTNFIFQNGVLSKVTNRKAFLNYFSENSKAIKTFMKKNKIRYSKANNNSMITLLKYCDDISSGKN